jgi:hypothetical protein
MLKAVLKMYPVLAYMVPFRSIHTF